MSIDDQRLFPQQLSTVPGQRTAVRNPIAKVSRLNRQQQNANEADPLITAVPNFLQNDALVNNLSRNTPAMPMVASAATHKLSGFFMPGSFSA